MKLLVWYDDLWASMYLQYLREVRNQGPVTQMPYPCALCSNPVSFPRLASFMAKILAMVFFRTLEHHPCLLTTDWKSITPLCLKPQAPGPDLASWLTPSCEPSRLQKVELSR